MVLSSVVGSNADLHALEALAEYLQQETEERSRALAKGVVSPRLAAIALRLRKLNGTLSSESSEGTVSIQVKIPANASHPQIAA